MRSLLNSLFGCSHRKTTFPLTPKPSAGAGSGRGGTYIVCLDCGREFDYDWREMRVRKPVRRPISAAAQTRPVRIDSAELDRLTPAADGPAHP